ncbi:MAG: hypothetical protein JNL32_04790 [Candidatus Kapabacteria bacterium]|nr:hypothetical protein [Candidatus Kapabacteria bacterium]
MTNEPEQTPNTPPAPPDLKRETSAVVEAEEQCRAEINAIITQHNCTIVGEINITPPFPTQSKVYIVHNARTDVPTPEIEQIEKLVENQITQICMKYDCVGLTKFKIAKGVAGCIPLFVHRSRLAGYINM